MRKRSYVVCIHPGDNEDLPRRRIYESLPDPSAERSRWLRVIDDPGEDYLYPASCFVAVVLPRPLRLAIERRAG